MEQEGIMLTEIIQAKNKYHIFSPTGRDKMCTWKMQRLEQWLQKAR